MPEPASTSVRPSDVDPSGRTPGGSSAPTGRIAAGQHGGGRRRRGDLTTSLVLALLVAFLVKTFVVGIFAIPSPSMAATLPVGSRVAVEEVSYRFRDPRRGEVVVFRNPQARQSSGIGAAVAAFLEGFGVGRDADEVDLVKRVVALPGETVAVRRGQVVIDGTLLDEPYARLGGPDLAATVVPDGAYFVLGDNRAQSADSRDPSVGTVPRETIRGRAVAVLLPVGAFDTTLGAEPLPEDES